MWIRRYAPIVAVCLLAAATSSTAVGQAPPDGRDLYEAGEKALSGGDFKGAVKYFSRAMRSNTLSSKEIASALFNRGVANRELGKPGHAIADLNSALWLEELSPVMTARAHFHRGLAYQGVGMKQRAGTDFGQARKLAPGDKVIAEGLKALGSGVTIARPSAPIPSFRTTLTPSTRRERAPRAPDRPAAAAQPPPAIGSFETEIRQQAPQATAAPTRVTPTPAAESPSRDLPQADLPSWSTSVESRPEPAAEAKPKRSGSRMSRLLDSLWGSSDEEKEVESAAPAPVNQDWSGTATSVQRTGTYRLQLASVKSQDEAQKVWENLAARHKTLLDGRQPTIEKTTLGNLGTFYRLQIGPFADKTESLKLCNTFKRSGVECFLISQ